MWSELLKDPEAVKPATVLRMLQDLNQNIEEGHPPLGRADSWGPLYTEPDETLETLLEKLLESTYVRQEMQKQRYQNLLLCMFLVFTAMLDVFFLPWVEAAIFCVVLTVAAASSLRQNRELSKAMQFEDHYFQKFLACIIFYTDARAKSQFRREALRQEETDA